MATRTRVDLAATRNVKDNRNLKEGGEEPVPRWDYVGSGERLTAGLEGELASRAQEGDEAARERMIQANIPLVVSIARQYSSPHLEAEDLIQEGMIGLCTAVERFQPSRGFRFSTYATYWIKQRVLRALDRNSRLIRLPADVAYAARKAQSVQEASAEKLGRQLTPEELAPECGVSARRLEAVLNSQEEPLSLDAPLGEDGDPLTLEVADHSTAGPEEHVIQAEENRELSALLHALPRRDRMVLEARFGIDGPVIPLAELAEQLHLTREGVRQIQRRALLKLRRKWRQRAEQSSLSESRGTGCGPAAEPSQSDHGRMFMA